MSTDNAAARIEGLLGDENPESTFDADHRADNEEVTELDTDDGIETSDELPETTDESVEEGAESEDDDGDDALDDSEESTETASTLQEIAEALEVPFEDFLANQKLSFKAAGEEVTATLSELQASYQKEADYRKKSMALADERRDFEATRERQHTDYEATSHSLAATLQNVQQMVVQQMDGPEMQRLREEDPAEWNARMREADNQLGFLNSVAKDAADAYEQRKQADQQSFLQAQGKILSEQVDGWGEEKLSEAVEVMKGLGFSEDEIPSIGDARLIMAALQFKALQAENEELKAKVEGGDLAAKKVKKLPKTLKPGTQTRKGSNIAKLKAQLRKSPSGRANIDAATAAIENLL